MVEQLQGFELAAGAWESHVLAARVTGYRREWLDDLCISGQVSWGRLSVRDAEPDPEPRPGEAGPRVKRSGLVPSRATPITLTIRDDLPWLLRVARGDLVPGRARARAAPPTCSRRSASTVRCSARTWPPGPAACPARWTRRYGTVSPAA